MLELKLSARRGGFELQIACRLEAQWTVVFGPSGAGKSTLLRLIAGLERPDFGSVRFDEETLTDVAGRVLVPPGRRWCGLVAQRPALFPHLSVAANVAYGLAGRPEHLRRSTVAEMLALTGASLLAERRPGALSGGEAQRVALARALAPSPRLLLLDEPLSALDAAARDEVLSRLQAWLAAAKVQTILVTHDAADALATQAEVAVMRDGTLAALGPAAEVLAQERERLLARLLG